MTVNSTTRKAGPYIGNGTTVVFPFSFKVFATQDVKVVKTDTLGIESNLVMGTDYSVTLNSNQNSNPGGFITMLAGAPATGILTTLTSSMAYTQTLDLTNLGGFYPATINDALDRQAIQIQQLVEQVGRSVKTDISSSVTPDQLIATLITNVNNAISSATSAGNSASSSANSATASANSATASANSAASSNNSASIATTKASDSSNSANNSANSASSSANSAALALAIYGNTLTMNNAVNSATASANTATSKAADSANSAAAAAASASTATSKAADAANSANSTAALLASFRSVLLGAFASDSAAVAFASANSITLVDGVMYENTTGTPNKFRIYNGTSWDDYDSSAQVSQSAAALSAANAAASAAAALTSKNNAATSETNSANSATASAASAAAALTSKNNAATSETNSAASAAEALTSKNNASTSETNSANSANSSANSASLANTSKVNAATSETNSANSAAAAASSASDASSSKSLAADWAEKLTGLVSGIGYSAKYWAQQAAAASGGGVAAFNGRNGIVSLLSSDVLTALGFTPENASNKNINNGYAGLDSSGKIPSTLLPSYVDDVLEYANLASFPGTGESGKIYTALDTNKIYRWSGSVYVEISGSPGTTDSLTEGSVNKYFTTARASAAAPVQSVAGKSGNVALVAGDISGLGSLATKSNVGVSDMSATGTPSSSNYLRGDNAWVALAGSTLDVTGTTMLFVQTTAPTGWTKSTTHNDKALRIVSGTASSGGSVAFTAAFAASLSAGATTLSTAQMPSHSHTSGFSAYDKNWIQDYCSGYSYNKNGGDTGATGGGSSHSHSLPSFAVQYVDAIIAVKN